MPSSSNLFLGIVSSLVARCAEPEGKMAFFRCSTSNTARVLSGPLLKCMFFAVCRRGNNNKILNSVILSVAVFMVYVQSFWSICYNAMFVLPLVWLCNFYTYVDRTVSCLTQFLCSDWKLDADSGKHGFFGIYNAFCERFVRTIRTSWCIAIRIAVIAFFTYDWRVAKRAQFG